MSEKAMQDAKLEPYERDYCAHFLADLYRCKRDNYPFVFRCKHMKHPYDECQYQEYVYFISCIQVLFQTRIYDIFMNYEKIKLAFVPIYQH